MGQRLSSSNRRIISENSRRVRKQKIKILIAAEGKNTMRAVGQFFPPSCLKKENKRSHKNMNCEYQIKGNTLRIYIPKELDHHISDSLREEADLLTETYFIRNIIFDFSRTEWMDSSGIGVILGRYKNMKFSGGTVRAEHLNERMYKIFHMSGLDELIAKEGE